MSFSSAVRRLFGFGDSEDDEIIENYMSESDESVDEQVPEANATSTDVPQLAPLPTIDPEMKARIFDGVLAIFNEALPDFISKSIDPAAQRARLLAALDKSADEYLTNLVAEAERHAESKLRASSDAAHREADKLKEQMQQLEQQRQSLREQQLSADRRRRALADRVNDLESRIASAEAEREQYQLENKSLLNKLKVADIQPGVVDQLTQEIEQLKAQLQAGNSADTGNKEVESLKEQLAEALQKTEESEKRVIELQNEITTLNNEADSTRAANENLKEQQTMGQAMYNDLQTKLAEEREKTRGLEAELDEANQIISSVTEMQKRLEQVSELIAKRDERIEKLKNTNKKLREEIGRLKECVSAGAFGGLFDMADQAVEPDTKKAISPEMAAIEEEFECPDWFVSEPPPGENPLRPQNTEFGYVEPPKKPKHHDNDAQLSLF
ncbi:MAG: hypothetical protein K2I69_09570 [Muribaculaceae bacterium]|nr:hypothetical protein [Muribaculaceae bacterium]